MRRTRHRPAPRPRRLLGLGPWALAGLGGLAALGLVWLVAGSGLPALLAGPGADPVLGALNRCLLEALPAPRRAWAVSADARAVAAAAEAGLAVCTQEAPPAGPVQLHARLPPPGPGVSALAFDGQGRLWAASAAGLTWTRPTVTAAVWSPPLALQAQGLWGLADGVLVLEAAAGGSETALLSVAPDGALRARRAVPPDVHWAVGPHGRLVAGVADGALLVLSADGLEDVRPGRPCDATAVAWTDVAGADGGEPGERLLVGCRSGLTLYLWPRTGESTVVGRRPVPLTQRLLHRPLHVGDCDGLPCTAAAP